MRWQREDPPWWRPVAMAMLAGLAFMAMMAALVLAWKAMG